jgi:hypothetical protein
MTLMDQISGVPLEVETPFAESPATAAAAPASFGLLSWTETASPFTEAVTGEFEGDTERRHLIAEAFESLRDELFDEAPAELIGETAEAADVRVAGEQPMQLAENRRQLADAHLASIGLEAEQCVQRFVDEMQHLDLEGLAPGQLAERLDRFEPGVSDLSPAGEEFIGGLIKKAKNVVKTVVNTAGRVATAALPILGPSSTSTVLTRSDAV